MLSRLVKPLGFLFAAALFPMLATSTLLAGAAPEEAIAVLQKRGYTNIEIAPDESPGYLANACKRGTRFVITMDPKSNIIDVDPQGPCGEQPNDYASAPQQETPLEQGDGGYKGESYVDAPRYDAPVVTRSPLIDRLARQGYYDIRIVEVDDDEIEVLACRKGRLYELEIKRRNGRIDDIDRRGRCGPRRHAGRYETHVEAPFAGVHVGRDEVHIRAPFVDLRVPRWD